MYFLIFKLLFTFCPVVNTFYDINTVIIDMYTIIIELPFIFTGEGVSHGVVANVLDCSIVKSKFKLQLC